MKKNNILAQIFALALLIILMSGKLKAQIAPVHFTIRGTGLNNSVYNILKIDDQTIYSTSRRGLRLTVLNRSGLSIISDQTYDTFGSESESELLATALNNINSAQIGILTSFDAWEGQATQNLDHAFLRLGLTKAAATENSGSRRPYAAIFEGASNNEKSGKAVEVSFENSANQPFALISGYFLNQSFVATGSLPNALLKPQGDGYGVIVDYNGQVGIGTINPSEKLTVDGKILAEEVKVQNVPQSDYVFEPDYPLLPLAEVESYIKENKHLPDIPSAEEFKQNGVGLGEMDDMLLRKIEELTLYVIEQQKELEKLKKENESLQISNESLIIRLEKLENNDQE